MYVLAAGTTSIDVLALNAPGQAKNIQNLDFSGPASAVGLIISMYPCFVFAADHTLTGLTHYAGSDNVQGMTSFIKK
jgi:hypothetical protein